MPASHFLHNHFLSGRAIVGDSGPVYYRILTAVQATIQGLGLSGISSANIIAKKLPLVRVFADNSLSLPGVLITPQREQITGRGTNLRDDIVYGVLVTFLETDNQEKTLAANLSRHLQWRETVAGAFRSQRLNGVDEVVIGNVSPLDAVDGGRWLMQYFAGAVLLQFTARQART